jgi:hypothetical protein
VAVIAALIFMGASLSQYVAVLISLLALTVSIVSAFKEDIFSFQPVVLFDEIIMAPPSGPSHDSIALVLPLTFINKGHGAGVVNMLALRVESADGMKLYTRCSRWISKSTSPEEGNFTQKILRDPLMLLLLAVEQHRKCIFSFRRKKVQRNILFHRGHREPTNFVYFSIKPTAGSVGRLPA